MTANLRLPGFSGPDSPSDADLYRCVHCGLCLQACPTYVETGLETESPRGRLALMKAVKEERLPLTERVVEHLDLCVQCRACEAVCPSGVPFGRVMEAARAQVVSHTPRSWRERLARFIAFNVLLTHLGLLRAAAWLLKLYQRSGAQWLVREFGLLKLFKGLDRMERQLPPLGRFGPAPSSQVAPAVGERKHRVALLSGCVMPLIYGRVNEATMRVLARNGCEVVLTGGQGCCGALHTHSGERETARAMARKNIDAFLAAGVEAVIGNSAGCGAAMKDYADLLKDDPAYAEKAERFSRMVQDINQYLVGLPLKPPKRPSPSHAEGSLKTPSPSQGEGWDGGRLPPGARVTYQDSCHLAHAQRIKDAPRVVLNAIPGLKLVEMENSDMCCGAGGIYSITHRDLSMRILDHKMEHALATKADIIATANPGCMLQLETGKRRSGMSARVVHVVELLDEAYRAEPPSNS